MKKALSWLFLTLFIFTVLLTVVSCDRTTPPTTTDSGSPTETAPSEESIDRVTEEPTEGPTEEPLMDREYRILDSADRFKLSGNRMAPLGDGITCDFTASGIEFRGFHGGQGHALSLM